MLMVSSILFKFLILASFLFEPCISWKNQSYSSFRPVVPINLPSIVRNNYLDASNGQDSASKIGLFPDCLNELFDGNEDDQQYELMTKWLVDSSPGNLTCRQDRAEAPNAHVVALKWLVSRHPLLLSHKDCDDRTIAHRAAARGLPPIIDWLAKSAPHLLERVTRAGDTVAHVAAAAGHLPLLARLAERDPAALVRLTCGGETIAHAAAAGGVASVAYSAITHIQCAVYSCSSAVERNQKGAA